MAGRDLGEPGRPRQLRQALLHGRVAPGVDQRDGAGADAVRMGRLERRGGCGLIQRLDLAAVHADAAGHLGDALVQQRRQLHVQVEQAGTGLVADPQQVAEAPVHHQQRALALALQQGIGGDGGAHADLAHQARGHWLVRRDAQHRLDPGDGGVLVAAGVLAQQLAGAQRPVGRAGDKVGEGAAAVDPELPSAMCAVHAVSLPGAAGR